MRSRLPERPSATPREPSSALPMVGDMSPMRRSSKVWIGIAAGVVVLGVAAAIAGPYVYRDLISGPPEAVPTVAITADPESKTTLDTSDLSGEWTVGAS